jgi:hypothetical protein
MLRENYRPASARASMAGPKKLNLNLCYSEGAISTFDWRKMALFLARAANRTNPTQPRRDAADDDAPFGFDKKPKYKQTRKKMKWRWTIDFSTQSTLYTSACIAFRLRTLFGVKSASTINCSTAAVDANSLVAMRVQRASKLSASAHA